VKRNSVSTLLQTALNSDVLSQEDSAFIVYDLDYLEEKFKSLKEVFPANTLHGIAIKSCPLPFMMKMQALLGLGAEAASIEEVMIAHKSGVPAEKIIFDGPAKTKEEIQFCIDKSIYINIDNFEELERVAKLVGDKPGFKAGFRVNPQIGSGKISDTSVAGKTSKFGVNLNENKERLTKAFADYSWLVGLHVHIGSQGMALEELVRGTRIVFEYAQTVDGLERFDLGGGLPVVYKEGDPIVSFQDYTDLLRAEVPAMFNSDIQLLTEFGRSVYADTAIAVSRIEYVKEDRQIVAHLGADMFLRRVYKPNDWHHGMSVYNPKGEPLSEGEQDYTVAGPLCFGGDFLAREVKFPKVHEHDFLAIHDVGAYTLAMWSRHCSRFTPKVIGVRKGQVQLIKKRETIEQLIDFWS
jgi:diaminopimelate decarboxylase